MASAVETSPEIFDEAAQVASRFVTPVGGQAAAVPILGTRGLVRYRLDIDEDERRRDAQLGAILSPGVLELLLGLPLEVAVPVMSLTPLEHAALRVAPAGAVAVDAGWVTRQAVFPLVVDLAIISVRRWQVGLEIAGRFTPFCSRVIMLRHKPKDSEDLRMEADFYGIGVAIAHGVDVEVLVPPQAFRRRRFTAAGWRFLEKVYHHVRKPVPRSLD